MTKPHRERPAKILLVEDNADDVELLRLSFARAEMEVDMLHVEDGAQCMRVLRKEGEYADALTPDLILLDLNLPVMDGREVLSEIVRDDALRALPVVVLTTSSAEQDIIDMYRLRCSSYITKPVEFGDFQNVVQQIRSYWFTLVELPTVNGNAA